MSQVRVVQLPTELHKMREASRLVDRWHEIQAINVPLEKTAALFDWRLEMEDHARKFRDVVK